MKDAARAIARHGLLVALAAAVIRRRRLRAARRRAMVSYAELSLARRIVLTFYGVLFCVAKTLWPSDLAPLHQGNVGTTWEFHAFVWWQAAAGFAS